MEQHMILLNELVRFLEETQIHLLVSHLSNAFQLQAGKMIGIIHDQMNDVSATHL